MEWSSVLSSVIGGLFTLAGGFIGGFIGGVWVFRKQVELHHEQLTHGAVTGLLRELQDNLAIIASKDAASLSTKSYPLTLLTDFWQGTAANLQVLGDAEAPVVGAYSAIHHANIVGQFVLALAPSGHRIDHHISQQVSILNGRTKPAIDTAIEALKAQQQSMGC